MKTSMVAPEEVIRVRDRRGETQAEFGQHLGVSAVTVSRWETGARSCKGHYAVAVGELDPDQMIVLGGLGAAEKERLRSELQEFHQALRNPDSCWRVEVSDEDFDYWLTQPFVSREVRTELREADVLLVPQMGLRDDTGPVFPGDTELILDSLRRAGDRLGVTVDICVDDQHYREFGLNSASTIIAIGTYIVKSLIAPTAAALLAIGVHENYKRKQAQEKDEVKRLEAGETDDATRGKESERRVRVGLTVVDEGPDGSRSATIDYEGPPDGVASAFSEGLEALRSGGGVIGAPYSIPESTKAMEAGKAQGGDGEAE